MPRPNQLDGTHGSVRWTHDPVGVVTVTLDDPHARTNMITDAHVEGLAALLKYLEESLDSVVGVVVTSAKESFFSGPEFELAPPPESGSAYGHLLEVRDQLRRLELIGRPVAAAMAGAALGGGFEIALACHYRVGLDRPDIRWALAERTMGIMPGGGGTARATRIVGLAVAVRETVGEGVAYSPAWALSRGLVDELASTPEEVVAQARRWVIAVGPDGGGQLWDREGWKPPGGEPGEPAFDLEVAELRAELHALPADLTLPARHEILDAALIALSQSAGHAFEAETAAFLRLAQQPGIEAARLVFAGLKRTRDRAEAGEGASNAETVPARYRTFDLRHSNPLVDVFFPNSPKRVVEVEIEASASEIDVNAAVSRAAAFGVPIVVRPADGSTLHRVVVGEPVPNGSFADPLEAVVAEQLLGQSGYRGT